MYFFGSFRISKSPVIKNEAFLKQYLGTEGMFPRFLKTSPEYGSKNIYRLSIIPQTKWVRTDDCVSDKIGSDPVFCFDESVQKGQMIINIYPNMDVLQTEPKTKDRFLNLNLLAILETRFGINPNKKNPVLDNGEVNFIFKW